MSAFARLFRGSQFKNKVKMMFVENFKFYPLSDSGEPKTCYCIITETDIVAPVQSSPGQWQSIATLNFYTLYTELLVRKVKG